MSKYMKYIFAKTCIIRIYFAYIFFRDIHQNIFDIYYSKALEIYFHAKKLYMSHIYFIFMRDTFPSKIHLIYFTYIFYLIFSAWEIVIKIH